MRTYYIVPALAGLLAATSAAADAPAAGDAKQQTPPPWYQVEVVVFAHADASDTEIWRDDPGTPDTAHAVSLQPAQASPDLQSELQALSQGGGHGEALAAFLSDKPTSDTGATDQTPVAFRLLPENARQLQDVVTRLDHADGYRVLYHAAWRQPAYSPDQAVPVHIDDDPYGTQAAMLRAMDQAGAQAPDRTGGETGDDNAAQNGDGRADAAPPLIWRINGVVELTQSRYLHLRADLIYQVQTPTDPGTQTVAEGTVDEDTEVVHTYRLEQSRRILNDDLYYFDHPEFGLLAKVTPYEVPKPAAPQTPAQSDQPAPQNP